MTAFNTPQFSLDRDHPSLDLANTVTRKSERSTVDELSDYGALIAFAVQTTLLPVEPARDLLGWSRERPHEARAIHARAVALREAIFGIVHEIAARREPEQRDLDLLAREFALAMSHTRLTTNAEGLDWGWDSETHPERPLWPLARAAIDLLATHDLNRLRVCAADDCDWLFYDTSRNHSRKWCDMSTCGNRAKVARYREGTGKRD